MLFGYRFQQRSSGVLVFVKVLRRVGAHANHRIEAVKELNVALRQSALNLFEGGRDIAGKRRGREIHNEFLAEVERRRFREREVGERESLVFFVKPPVNLPVVTLVVEREACFHQGCEIAANGFGRDDVTVREIGDSRPTVGFDLLEDRPLSDQLCVAPHSSISLFSSYLFGLMASVP